jgi:hypothetical protein
MACRGWYTALLPDEAEAIRSASDVDDLLEKLNNLYPAADQDARIQSVDKSWDAMHRVLCGGWLDDVHGERPLRACVLGATQLSDRDDWIISFVEPSLVKEVVAAIKPIDEAWFRAQYFALDRNPHGSGVHRYEAPEFGEQDFEYTWSYFCEVRDFYRRAAERGLAVIFAVDQ